MIVVLDLVGMNLVKLTTASMLASVFLMISGSIKSGSAPRFLV